MTNNTIIVKQTTPNSYHRLMFSSDRWMIESRWENEVNHLYSSYEKRTFARLDDAVTHLKILLEVGVKHSFVTAEDYAQAMQKIDNLVEVEKNEKA